MARHRSLLLVLSVLIQANIPAFAYELLATYPSGTPTSSPTFMPTTTNSLPSGVPTGAPSYVPTESQTYPTGIPTGEPTSIPTGEPSFRPSGEPTSLPTGEPSKQSEGEQNSPPTSQPIPQPTPQPSFVGETLAPTGYPTIAPSVEPKVTYKLLQTVSGISVNQFTKFVQNNFILTVANYTHVLPSQVHITGVQSATATKRLIVLTSSGVTVSYIIDYANSTVAPNTTYITNQLSTSNFTDTFKQNLISSAKATNNTNVITFVNSIVTAISLSVPILVTSQPTVVPTLSPLATTTDSTRSSHSSLSKGDIAAAVIMSIFGACLIAGVLFFYCMHRAKQIASSKRRSDDAYFESLENREQDFHSNVLHSNA